MKIDAAPSYQYVSELLSGAEKAIEALKGLTDDDLDLEELYELNVEIGSPIYARFSGLYATYRYIWTGESWRRES